MKHYFNDSPIENPDDDRYGIAPFAQSLAESIANIDRPVGTAIAINGPWGSGKSSAVNLIKSEIKEAADDKLIVLDFMCWWYRGEEALALAFLQNLHATLCNTIGQKVKELIPKLGRGLLQASHVIGPAVALATTGEGGAMAANAMAFADKFFSDSETLEQTFAKLAKILDEQDCRFLVIIDDIDRLSPEEALAMFRLVKSVGRLPNVMYLLVFDRKLADQAIAAKYPSEGRHYLEKIIQASFELPKPLPVDLHHAALASVEAVCGTPSEAHMTRFMNVFYDVVATYIMTPRHVARLQNAICVTWPAVANNVNLADFIALETLRLYEPALFQAIQSNKDLVCGIRQHGDPAQKDDTRFDLFVRAVSEPFQDTAKIALQRLFPRLEAIGYGGDFISGWEAERRVCISKNFDTYFRLSLSDETLPAEHIKELINRADDHEFIKATLRGAAAKTRKNGQSMVPVYLDELNTYARDFDKEKVAPLLVALFEIFDEIELEQDEAKGFSTVNTNLRYYWLIRRLTQERFTIDARTDMYVNALQTASFGWLIDFTDMARRACQKSDSMPQREEDYLTTEEAIPGLIDQALEQIRTAATDGTLLRHNDLLSILYRWHDLADDDGAEVKRWTSRQMENDGALVILAGRLTGHSWTRGLGGFGSLGDRVSRRTVRAKIDDEITILDPVAFRENLERLSHEATLDAPSLEVIDSLLEAWNRQIKGQDDLLSSDSVDDAAA